MADTRQILGQQEVGIRQPEDAAAARHGNQNRDNQQQLRQAGEPVFPTGLRLGALRRALEQDGFAAAAGLPADLPPGFETGFLEGRPHRSGGRRKTESRKKNADCQNDREKAENVKRMSH